MSPAGERPVDYEVLNPPPFLVGFIPLGYIASCGGRGTSGGPPPSVRTPPVSRDSTGPALGYKRENAYMRARRTVENGSRVRGENRQEYGGAKAIVCVAVGKRATGRGRDYWGCLLVEVFGGFGSRSCMCPSCAWKR